MKFLPENHKWPGRRLLPLLFELLAALHQLLLPRSRNLHGYDPQLYATYTPESCRSSTEAQKKQLLPTPKPLDADRWQPVLISGVCEPVQQ